MLTNLLIRCLPVVLLLNPSLPFGAFTATLRNAYGETLPTSAVVASTEYAASAAMLEAFIRREMEDKDLQAVSIALVDDQRVVWSKGFGYSDPRNKVPATGETVYRVGSVSKLFTDIAVMQLVERGELELDQNVTRYLPGFRPRNPFGKPITLRQLMSHRSGLVREPPVGNYFDPTEPTLAASIESLNRTELVYEPGTRTKYSNAGIAAVGYVLERTRREPFASYLRRAVIDPLGLRQSDFELTPALEKKLARGFMWTVDGRTFEAPTFQLGIAPAGSMYTTVNDLARFVSALFNGGRGVNGPILKPSTLAQMWTPQFARKGEKAGFGIGFNVSELDGHRKIGHGGAIYGFSTQLTMLPEDKLGVVVVSTKDFSNAVTTRVADLSLRAMLAERERKPVPQPEATTSIDPETARRLAGRYAAGDKGFDLIESAGRLYRLSTGGGYQSRLRQSGDALVVDSPFAYGEKLLPLGDRVKIGSDTFSRVESVRPNSAPEKWRGLIGEYGWDHDVLYIFEKDGKLWSLIEWFEFNPLEEISEDVYKFPNRGLYEGERLVFKRDARNRATEVVAANVLFKRREVGPEAGAQQLVINPLRPVAELLEEALRAQPPKETGEFRAPDLVELIKLDPTIRLDVRYATTNNLFGTVFYKEARAFMQRPAAEALVRVNGGLKKLGYGLMVHDAYRPWYVTKVFWDATPDDKKIFVANPSRGSRHNRGAAVDLTLYDLKTGKPVEMVSTYDETTSRAYADYPGGTSLQRWHRRLLRDAMEAEGFTVYDAEWWHFDYKDWRSYPIGNTPFEKFGAQGNPSPGP